MRRAQAILVLLTLAALPLVPLAQAAQMSACTCSCACCMRYGVQRANSAHGMHTTVYCKRDSAYHACGCGMMSRPSGLSLGFAPIPPTLVSSLKTLARPSVSVFELARDVQQPASGFLPDLFEPPRA